jgi:hypothetical protein
MVQLLRRKGGEIRMRRIILLATVALIMTAMLALLGAGTAAAHVHLTEKNPHHDQQLASGQNHPGFEDEGELVTMCEGDLEPQPPAAPSGPAGYGLETAHHGPDAGTPGNGDGCYSGVDDGGALPPEDTNPAIK